MRSWVTLCLLVAACSSGDGTPEQACARQADNAPAVRELVIRGMGNLNLQWENAERLKLARRDATLACLRSRGLAPKGGVERPQP